MIVLRLIQYGIQTEGLARAETKGGGGAGAWGLHRKTILNLVAASGQQRIEWVCFARYRKRLLNRAAAPASSCIMQEALDPSGTSTNEYLDGRSCFGSWGSSTAEDYCTWHERDDEYGQVIGVLCGGCTASEEPRHFGQVANLGCPMDSSHPSHVTYLALGTCGLEGSLPWSLLGQLTWLQYLNLYYNPDLTGTALGEEGLAALTQLRYLNLGSDTQLSGTFPAATLGGLAQLRDLRLDHTQVDATQCESFCDGHASTVSTCRCP
eukprot:SAG31_NODE_526_length_14475_cov_5.135197_2_plen_265_part_00